jgi:uncharacterized protein (TIGR03067 family)
MKTKLMAVMLLFGAWSVVATGQGDDKELEKFTGTWKLTSEVDSGMNIPADPQEVFVFKGKNLVNRVGPKITDEFEVKLNPGKTPKEIDLIPLKEPNKGVPSPAIYKMEGNKLTICVNFAPGGKRPTAFESNQTNRNIILTMEKMDEKKKDKDKDKDK